MGTCSRCTAVRSLAYAGVAVVLFAALASLIVAPAAILVTAKRVAKSRAPHPSALGDAWYRWARAGDEATGPISVVATTVPAARSSHCRFST